MVIKAPSNGVMANTYVNQHYTSHLESHLSVHLNFIVRLLVGRTGLPTLQFSISQPYAICGLPVLHMHTPAALAVGLY